jgi:hypothetical protein
MLDTPDPAPTGLITALLGRARPAPSAITAAIGPSPRQMRELAEGRGLFSPYKLGRVAALTRVPEPAIRDALARLPELVRLLDLREGSIVQHPRLGDCEVIMQGPEVTVRTGSGAVIEGIHPASFAGPELLDRFGLTPTAPDEETEDRPAVKIERAPATVQAPRQAARKPDTIPDPAVGKIPDSSDKTEDKETNLMSAEPDILTDAPTTSRLKGPAEPAIGGTDSRDVLRDLISRSGMSQAALSRALGKDPSFLNAILNRGRRMPDDVPDRILALISAGTPCGPDPVSQDPVLEPRPNSDPGPLPSCDPGSDAAPAYASQESEATDFAPPQTDDPNGGAGAPGQPAPTSSETAPDRTIVLECSSSSPEPDHPEVIEVIIEGVCRLRVPHGFDMEAAARLIRSVSAPFRSAASPV